jgi:hypothetical protein
LGRRALSQTEPQAGRVWVWPSRLTQSQRVHGVLPRSALGQSEPESGTLLRRFLAPDSNPGQKAPVVMQ